ncbi:hypothetical protein TNCV_4428931 [Trichonephila clavipes]|nr:hypothetical protein TNCV_4428931 [Trichonephila clavipes]
MPPNRLSQNEAYEIYRWKGLDTRQLFAVVLSTIQMTVRLGSVSPEHPGGGQGSPIYLPLPPIFDGYLEYPHAVKVLCIYKHPYLLRDLNPVLTSQQPVVHVTSHYTRWTAGRILPTGTDWFTSGFVNIAREQHGFYWL